MIVKNIKDSLKVFSNRNTKWLNFTFTDGEKYKLDLGVFPF